MQYKIETKILINAQPDKVWKILTDTDAYPEWNPFVKYLKGDIIPGKTIEVSLPGMNFKPKVLSFEKNKEFRWLGHLFIKGLFDGEHSFELIENENGHTVFKHTEKFNGILVPFLKKKLDTDIKNGFNEMNISLKNRVELV